ncbi:MAG: hypothetical protein CM15mP103_02680 [Gammaproteobacteria bacterium]|nr:MAG: hypothetical protein CM15mP103_02680 [Gammaproteobacteria bacterium]
MPTPVSARTASYLSCRHLGEVFVPPRCSSSPGIHCNATDFSFEQARACADAGVFLIFTLRRTHHRLVYRQPAAPRLLTRLTTPGVQSVKQIYETSKPMGMGNRCDGSELPEYRTGRVSCRL